MLDKDKFKLHHSRADGAKEVRSQRVSSAAGQVGDEDANAPKRGVEHDKKQDALGAHAFEYNARPMERQTTFHVQKTKQERAGRPPTVKKRISFEPRIEEHNYLTSDARDLIKERNQAKNP